jgi:hypothetical protein
MLSVPYALIAFVRAVTWVVKALVSESTSSEKRGQPWLGVRNPEEVPRGTNIDQVQRHRSFQVYVTLCTHR